MHYLARFREKSNYDLDNIIKYTYIRSYIHLRTHSIKKEKNYFHFRIIALQRLHPSDSEQCSPEAPTRQR